MSAPFDQLYDAKPAPASRVTFPDPQIDDSPVMFTTGLGLTVTLTADEVPTQPLAFVTVTLKLPLSEVA